jgi:radical SAM-linked protein
VRVRLRFSELGRVRFVSHRDMARVWERAIRKARLPIAYSEGFSPRPRVHFGLALSVGHESEAEYLDIDLTEDVDVDALPDLLTGCLPGGIDVTGAMEVAFNEPSLQSMVEVVSWRFVVDGDPHVVADQVDRHLAADRIDITVSRKGSDQAADLRPALVELAVGDPVDDGVELRCDLATKPRSFRPAEVLASFDPPLGERRVRRIEQWIIHDDGLRRPPVPARSSSPPEPALPVG